MSLRRNVGVSAVLLFVATAGCRSTNGGAPGVGLARWFVAEKPQEAGAATGVVASAASAAVVPRVESPLVALNGQSRPIAAPPAGAKLLYARAYRAWVYERPSEDAAHLGYLRAGARVAATGNQADSAGCPGGWYPIAPRGYVCAGGGTTLDPNEPVVAALSTRLPDPARKLPYIYGTVRKPGPVYDRLPTAAELHAAEPDIDERMVRWLAADGEVGASYAQVVWLGGRGTPPDAREMWQAKRTDGVPAFLLNGGVAPNVEKHPRDPGQLVIGKMRAKVGYSFTDTFLWDGRRYGVTPDLEVLPTDRLRPIQGSEFHGIELGNGVDFPLALVRQPGARYVVYQKSSNALIEGEVAPYREAVPLTGRQQFFHDVLHYETKDGKWLSDRDASRLDRAKKMPGWAVKGERWIDINITKQTLVLYEGERAVYATLISSGEAGLEDPARTTATKRGIFRIHSKHVSNTMESDEVGEEFELRDVPYVQYFDDDGHAIHGAYWHDKFGIPKSHGCINLAPEDARRVFYWTEPEVPDGWHGAFEAHTGTVVFIHP
jgi:hypothetical protein